MSRRRRARAGRVLLVASWIGLACAPESEPSADARAAPPAILRLVPAPPGLLPRPPRPRGLPAFDVVATDVDLDGDTDVLVNWHHTGPFELLQNLGDRFRPLGDPEPTGLEEPLYAPLDAMLARVRDAGDGLYLWHDLRRTGRWQLLWRNASGRHPGLRLELDTSLAFLLVDGLEPGERTAPAPERLRVSLASDVRERRFSLQTQRVGVRLAVRRLPVRPGAATPPLFVGGRLEPAPPGELVVWKGDPHGMAWIDLAGTAHPELFVTRGGLGGELAPPRAPKHDAYFVHRGPGRPPYARAVVPPDYGRGRRVEAVDVDGDGRLELWIGCRESANRLLARRDGALHDLAPALGLDAREGAIGTWLDHDGDGWQDLLTIEHGALVLLRNHGGHRFERIPGPSLGLVLPQVEAGEGLFDASRLRPADVDRDGDLDLWLLGRGGPSSHRLFRRDGDRFQDVTRALGLASAEGDGALLVVDLDDDALPDLVQLGSRSAIWTNRGAAGFEAHALRVPLPRDPSAATVLDADGDGPRDLLVAGRGHALLLNRSQHGNRALEVTLDGSPAPVGAVVTAAYSDGSRLAQRYGSETSTPFSQALQALRFGVPQGLEIESVSVRWPGAREARRYPVEGRASLHVAP